MFDYNYLLQLIANRVEENPQLEYKSAGALQKNEREMIELTKDVSSLANSNGGVIIYGLTEEKSVPGKIDPIDRNVFTKERLEQIINSRIRPCIHGLKIHVVSIPENQDQVVYILEVPRGETAHQADDRKYYRRHNFTVEPMYDHEVRDVMGRQKNPVIEISFDISRKGSLKVGADSRRALDQYQAYAYWLNIYAENVGSIFAKYINLKLILQKRCVAGNAYDRKTDQTVEIKIDNKTRELIEPHAERYWQGPIAKAPQYTPGSYNPLLPGMRTLLQSIPINEYSTDAGNAISWTLYADNTEPKTGSVEFCKIKSL